MKITYNKNGTVSITGMNKQQIGVLIDIISLANNDLFTILNHAPECNWYWSEKLNDSISVPDKIALIEIENYLSEIENYL